jgi:hypothetical protein
MLIKFINLQKILQMIIKLIGKTDRYKGVIDLKLLRIFTVILKSQDMQLIKIMCKMALKLQKV